jgi:uncharacterized protein YukE/gas vesicle protein
MALNGMDVAAAEGIAAQLDLQAKAVAAVVGVVDGIVSGLMDVWEGHDVEAFASSWSQIHRTNATQVTSDLQGVVARLNAEVKQQIETSGGVTEGAAAGAGGLSLAAIFGGGLFGGLTAGDRTKLEAIFEGGGVGAVAGALAGVLGRPLVSTLYQVVDEGSGLLNLGKDAIGSMKISNLERLPDLAKGPIADLEELAESPVAKDLSRALPFIAGVAGGFQSWNQLKGEPTLERISTSIDTGGVDFAIARIPVLAGANVISFGAVTDDAGAVVDMLNGFAYGVGQGGVTEGLHDADQQLTQWADGIASGKASILNPLPALARGENNFIANNYGAISHAANVAVGDVTSSVNSVEHLATSGVSAGEHVLKSIF